MSRVLTEQERRLILELVKQGITYHEILDEVRSNSGSAIKTCHMAEVKRPAVIEYRIRNQE